MLERNTTATNTGNRCVMDQILKRDQTKKQTRYYAALWLRECVKRLQAWILQYSARTLHVLQEHTDELSPDGKGGWQRLERTERLGDMGG